MPQKLVKMSLACLLGVLALAIATSTQVAADETKVPTIKEIMQKGHKGTDAYMSKIKADAKAGKWEEAKEYAKTLAFFGENIGKNKPKKGDEKSWEKLTKKYTENTKATLKAVEAKDAAAVNKALSGINCMECHKMHR